MCTITWFVNAGQYSVFFNRDEGRKRPLALAPEIYRSHTQRHIMPVDPQGGGSWLGVNESGFTFALLNYYQGKTPKGRLHSRGQIIKEIISSTSYAEVKVWLEQQNLQMFAPFSLLVFSPELSQETAFSPEVPLIRWNGKTLDFESKRSPLFSSAIDFEGVCDTRESLYKKFIEEKNELSEDDFLQLHRTHKPEKSRYSICMHREDAHTVSFSHIRVSEAGIHFFYADGAPCQAVLQKAVSLPGISTRKLSRLSPNLQTL